MNEPKVELPAAVHGLLVRVRAGLKSADTTLVSLGWAEVRGIYAMHTATKAARTARDKALKDLKRMTRAYALAKQENTEIHLLGDRAVITLLHDVHRVLSGEEDSTNAVYDTRKRVAALLKKVKRRRAHIGQP